MASLSLFLLQDLAVAIIIFFTTRFFFRSIFKGHNRKLPPGPTGWPFLGALPILGPMPHVTLFKLARKYGPVMYLKMGTTGMVVASTPDAARAFLKTLDVNFSNRPPNAGSIILGYNADMVFADYGSRWKLERKISNLHMLGGKALDDWAHFRVMELGHMLRAMYDASKQGQPVVVPEMLTYAMANMIGQLILGKRVFETKGSESNEFKDMVVELMTSAGLFNIGDFIPFLRRFDLQGLERGMKQLNHKFDVLLTKMIEDHQATAHKRKGKPDFLDIVTKYMKENPEGEPLTMTNVKALLLNLFTAGTDTSSSIIEWALSEMLQNPSIMKRAHDEMDRVIGRQRRLQESDIPNLPYFQAICKETYRKHPSTPLNLPRVSTEACEVNGYYIPKGTRLSVNIWGIGRDPNVWDKPLEFNPDRFMSGRNAKIDPRGNDFELIPFGAGRRICAGTRMGIVLVHYILGTLIHSFDWKLPHGLSELNMEESFGLALQKKVPLAALVSPRLSPDAYIP
ncbi:flavonoid 3',5'-hydroxylase 2-like [Prosopis cineraria]|uniref:flavonoid 3',5'-hydroxylase 2-like n=1 Tax=Prosopis cineraria TaxID=364024 RepID=UPI00240FA4CE|nr:flavonoid 3',5'-hydroxylase 2-like [Prosopis cineraria]XP_054794907.1 flavonoid 3',5'-hydroxylase 2-like [Prosopis cineraria]